MVAGVARRLRGEERRAFLVQAGAALLLLATGVMAAGGCAERRTGEVLTGGGGLAPGGSVKMLEVETRSMSPVLAMTGSRPGRVPRLPAKLRVRLGKGSVRGALDKGVVRRLLRVHLATLNYCYLSEAAQSRKKPQPGQITADFQITGAGKTRRVKLCKGGLSTRIGKCVTKALGRVRYLAPRDGKPVTVRWTFHFK